MIFIANSRNLPAHARSAVVSPTSFHGMVPPRLLAVEGRRDDALTIGDTGSAGLQGDRISSTDSYTRAGRISGRRTESVVYGYGERGEAVIYRKRNGDRTAATKTSRYGAGVDVKGIECACQRHRDERLAVQHPISANGR